MYIFSGQIEDKLDYGDEEAAEESAEVKEAKEEPVEEEVSEPSGTKGTGLKTQDSQ